MEEKQKKYFEYVAWLEKQPSVIEFAKYYITNYNIEKYFDVNKRENVEFIASLFAQVYTHVDGYKFNKETEFDKRLKVRKKDLVIIKTRYDDFEKTVLEDLLKENKIEKITICGFMTNFCCETTARTAHGKDYYVDFIVDATGTPGTEFLSPKQTIKATIATLSSGFAVVKNINDIM